MKNKIIRTIKTKIYFNKWTRKNYSSMMSLNKIIKISVLSVGYFILNAFTTQAQTDTLKIEEIMIKAARTDLNYSDASRIISIVDKEEISSMPATGINDILSSVLSVDIRSRGAFGVQADMNIRGGSFEQGLVLINGMPVNDPQTGHFSLNLPVDVQDIQRIEVLEGAGSRVYGNNAFSGAVNIITRTSNENKINLSLLGGSYELWGAKISSAYSIKKFKNYLSFSKNVSAGYKENTDFDILNFYYSGEQSTQGGDIQVQAGFTDKSFGANSFYTPVYPNQYEQNKTAFINAGFKTQGKVNMSYSGYWRMNFDKFELFRDNPASWYTGPNYHTNNLFGIAVNSSFITSAGTTSVGLEANNASILSNKLGDTLNSTKPIPGAGGKYYTNGSSRQNISTFIEQLIRFGKFNVSAGVMMNWNSSFAWDLYTGVDITYLINEHFRLMTSVNYSGRLPSFTDLYYVGPTNIGNQELVPEKASTYEFGGKYINRFMVIQSAVFTRFGTNIIDWVKQKPEDKWQSQNITNVDAIGFEFSAKFSLQQAISESIPVNYIRFNYSFTEMDKASSDYISKYVLDYLQHSFVFSMEHNIYKNFKASWMFQYRKRNGSFIPYNQESGAWLSPEDYKSIYLLGLRLSYFKKAFKIFVEGSNLFDANYQDIENVELPGRWLKAGVNISINLKRQKDIKITK
jgi:iron complex outermembrane receptor protein